MPDTEFEGDFEADAAAEPESATGTDTGTDTETDTDTATEAPSDTTAPSVEAAPVWTVPDDVLLAAAAQARDALKEITPEATIGAPAGHIVEGEHVLSLLFECTMRGYPGWHWTVTLSRIDGDAAPSVLEAELMPGERALLAPDWVPWSERLADYQASQEAIAAAEAEALTDDDGDDTDDEDADDFDDEDDDEDGEHDVHDLHPDDLDGVDIESADESYDDESEGDESEGDATDDDESAPFDGEVGEADESEDESDDDRPEPPAVSGGAELPEEDERHDEGDHPQA